MSAECSAETISPGYKQTEVGVIPEDWDVKKLGEVVDIDADNLSAGTSVDYAFNYISLEDVDEGLLRSYSSQIFGSAPSRARRRLRYGDVLVSTVRPNLKSHLLFGQRQGEWICSTGFSVVRCKNSSAVPSYIFSHLFATTITKQIESLLTGSNYPAINGKDVKALLIPLPPTLAEQEAIAEALSDADTLIGSLEQLVAKKRQIKQGAMQELLTGKRRLPGFGEGKGYKQTEVGVIPEDWSAVDYISFGQVIDGDRGVHYPSAFDLQDTGYCLFLNAGNVTKEGFRFSECQFISTEKDKKLNKGKLSRGDVILTTRGTLGNFAYYTKRVPFEHIRINSGMVILRNTAETVTNTYQYLVLRSQIVESQIERLSFGSAQPQLTVKGISTLKIPLPPTKSEQEAIATILSDMDSEISALEEKLAKTRQIKQGMMQ
ncbi:MAG TPA: hypothetical protein HA262_03800, partial [Methanosarcina sp.]|nr:hypothetical protein [Methanosarcina sp.]